MRMNYTGQTIDNRYQVLWLLDEGGMGAVYLGEHIRMGKKVAIKFLHSNFAKDDVVVKRFFREAEVAAKLQHPNIIDVMDMGLSSEGEPYLVMEYLEGESLRALLNRTGPLGLPTTLGIIEPVLHALETAHRQGIIHRDLKPDNIFLSQPASGDTVVKLIDFGISKMMDPDGQSQLTQTGSSLGTPMYMSPEQISADENLDHRTDIYAVGVILYKMLTNELPFAAENQHQLLMKIITNDPLPPKEAYPDFPDKMAPIVARLLQKGPHQRYQSAGELLGDLKKLAEYTDRKNELSLYTATISLKNGPALGNIGETRESPGQTVGGTVPEPHRAGGSPSTGDSGAGERTSNSRGGSGNLSRDSMGDSGERSGGFRDESTQDRWSNTVGPRPRLKWAVGAAVGVALIVPLIIFVLMSGPEHAPRPSVPPPPAETPTPPVSASRTSNAVKIHVTQAPPGATILWGRAPIPENPFYVDPSKKMVELKVTAPGHESFVQWVVPDQDQSIEAALAVAKPTSDEAVEVPPAKHAKAVRPAKGTKPRASRDDAKDKPAVDKPVKSASGERIVEVGGGAKLTESFED